MTPPEDRVDPDRDRKPEETVAHRSRNTAIRHIDDVPVIRRLASLGARSQAIRAAVGGEWTQETISVITRSFLGRGGRPGRRPGTASFANNRDKVHWTLAFLLYEIAKCWPRSDPDTLADAYELYAFVSRHITECRIAIESCVPFTGDVKLMAMQLVHCRECAAPRLVPSHQLRNLFVCEECAARNARDGVAPGESARRTPAVAKASMGA